MRGLKKIFSVSHICLLTFMIFVQNMTPSVEQICDLHTHRQTDTHSQAHTHTHTQSKTNKQTDQTG